MPPAVWMERDELLQQGASLFEAGDATERNELSFPGLGGSVPDYRGVDDEVDGVHDLGENRVGARRLRVA